MSHSFMSLTANSTFDLRNFLQEGICNKKKSMFSLKSFQFSLTGFSLWKDVKANITYQDLLNRKTSHCSHCQTAQSTYVSTWRAGTEMASDRNALYQMSTSWFFCVYWLIRSIDSILSEISSAVPYTNFSCPLNIRYQQEKSGFRPRCCDILV